MGVDQLDRIPDEPLTIGRRDFLRIGAGAILAARLSPLLAQEASAKRCIFLWMGGGPSHLDTWDLKSGNGPFREIDTAADGVRISEHLPQLAQVADRFTIVRSMTSKEADHDRAVHLLHTGNVPQETVEFPTLGAIASRECKGADGLPIFVTAGAGYSEPGFLGPEHAPFVSNPDNPTEMLAFPEGFPSRRLKLLATMNRAAEDPEQRRALAMIGSKAVEAFDIGREEESVRAAYGDSAFGRGCLLARRLIEHGVRFVEVALDGWDTHEKNFEQVEALSGQLDPAMASLLRELDERGLLKETLVLWAGEFGRTPEINGANGRDHHSAAFSVVLAGGGVAGGRVVGATDERGAEVTERPVTVPDLFASVFHALGFDPKKEYTTPQGRPVKLVEKGEFVRELFS